MTLTFVSCPYCNASMPPPAPESQRMACVRCGEMFPVAHSADAIGGESVLAIASAPPPSEVKRRNRWVGFAIVGGMALLFVAALVYALYSRGDRGMRSLAESELLGYLPDDTNLIAAVNVSAADDARKERKAGNEPDFVDRLFFGANAAIDIQQMTGLKRADVEEVMLGLRVDANQFIPNVRLIVRTRSSYDTELLRERLGSFRSKQEGAKSVDLIRPKGLPVEAVLWCATAKTFVITLKPEDMQKVPDEPSKNVDRLAAPLVDLLRYRGKKGTFFWLMGHSDNWEKTTLGMFAKTSKRLTDDERKKIFALRTFAFGMRLESGTTTSRSRPARITEQPDVVARGYAVDLVLNSATPADAIETRSLVEAWLKNQQLEIRDSNLKETTYSASLAGMPDDWEKAFGSIRQVLQMR